jgi:hypothetical protein
VLSRAKSTGTDKEPEMDFKRACVESDSRSRLKLDCSGQQIIYIKNVEGD